jgi:hypothetical protein
MSVTVKTDFEFNKSYLEDGMSIFLINAGHKLPYYHATNHKLKELLDSKRF